MINERIWIFEKHDNVKKFNIISRLCTAIMPTLSVVFVANPFTKINKIEIAFILPVIDKV